MFYKVIYMNIDENVQRIECSYNTRNGKKMMEMLETGEKNCFRTS